MIPRLSFAMALGLGLGLPGCEKTYLIDQSNLVQAQQMERTTPRDHIALRANPPDEEGKSVYLRYSMLNIPPPKPQMAAAATGQDGKPESAPLDRSYVTVTAPNKQGRLTLGKALLGVGISTVSTGLGLTIWGAVDIAQNPKGFFSGIPLFAGLPIVVLFMPFLISGAVVYHRNAGASDVVPSGQPDITYLPAARPTSFSPPAIALRFPF